MSNFIKAITARGNDDLTLGGEELGFSHASCECCGSQFAGDRFRAHKLTAGNDIRDYSVCQDCILYIANGDEPEIWYRSADHRREETSPKIKSLQQRLIEAKIPIDHHATDLYFLDTPMAREILRKYKEESAVFCHETFFVSPVDNKIWIECPFLFEKTLINNETLFGAK